LAPDHSSGQNTIKVLASREPSEEDLIAPKRDLETTALQVTSILENISDGFYVLDQEWRFAYINRRGLEMIQPARATRGSILGSNFWQEFPMMVGTEIERNFRRAVHDRITVEFETYFEPLKTWFLIRLYPAADALSVYFLDTTQRRASDAERMESEQIRSRLAAVVESSDDAIISMDLDTRITTWNKGAELMFGYKADEIIGHPINKLLPAGRQDEEPRIIEQLLRGERVEHYETVRLRKDGKHLDVSLTVSPIFDANGRIVGVSKISRDITARKEAEEKLRAAREQLQNHALELEIQVAERTAKLRETIGELEAFSYSVSHDMRSPLRAMQGYADALLEDYAPALDPTAQEYLSRIKRAASRMDLLIQDVLAYSRVTQGEIVLHPIHLEGVIRDVIQTYPTLQPEKAHIVVQGTLPKVLGHEAYLIQVISNILTNGVKFVPPGTFPEIQISATLDHDNVRINFKDNGIGIAPEHLEQIFQIFGRVYSEKQYEGTGIGLAIAKKAAERMGGSIGVDSKLGRGSTFYLILKRAE
jgi:PAS domain S-box-containing protein